MRRELFNRLKDELLNPENGLGIKHVDLWNHNVEFLDQETAWERPAVFVEFAPIRWKPQQRGVLYQTEAEVRLHIVTDWSDLECDLGTLDLSEAIHGVVGCMDGEKFLGFDIVQTATNHNHEDIVESIDTYSCIAYRSFNG